MCQIYSGLRQTLLCARYIADCGRLTVQIAGCRPMYQVADYRPVGTRLHRQQQTHAPDCGLQTNVPDCGLNINVPDCRLAVDLCQYQYQTADCRLVHQISD